VIMKRRSVSRGIEASQINKSVTPPIRNLMNTRDCRGSGSNANLVGQFLLFLVSPHGGGDRALALQFKGQWFDPRSRQLEKVVNLDENPWTHPNYKTSFRWPSGHWVTMSATVHLVHVHHDLCERHTFAKHKNSNRVIN
jgi:hypothetical protein